MPTENSTRFREELKFDRENKSNRLIIGYSINEEVPIQDHLVASPLTKEYSKISTMNVQDYSGNDIMSFYESESQEEENSSTSQKTQQLIRGRTTNQARTRHAHPIKKGTNQPSHLQAFI